MSVENVIALAAVGVAVVAALAASWQAHEARAARQDSRSAQLAAEEAATASASAATRTAAALEESNELMRSQLPRNKWRLDGLGQNRWQITNVSGRVLFAVALIEVGGADELHFSEDWFEEVPPNSPITFEWGRSFDSPRHLTLLVQWIPLGKSEAEREEFLLT